MGLCNTLGEEERKRWFLILLLFFFLVYFAQSVRSTPSFPFRSTKIMNMAPTSRLEAHTV